MKLGFGIVWLSFVSIFTFVFMASLFASGAPLVIGLGVGGFLSIFWFVGISMIRQGYKEYKANKETDLYGEECYAKIINVYESGSYVNDNPEYKADMIVYIPSNGEVLKLAETVGFNYSLFKPGTIVSGKYYNGDININKESSGITLPYEADEKIKAFMKHYNISDPANVIVIDGVEYVRKD